MTGRPLHADDVQDARRAWHRLPPSEKDQWKGEESFTADRLNRVMWGAPERECVHPELDGPCSGCAPERGDDEPRSNMQSVQSVEDVIAVLRDWSAGCRSHSYGDSPFMQGVRTGNLNAADGYEEAATVLSALPRSAAGSLPVMPPEVTEALGWFDNNPDRVKSVEGRLRSGRHAATVVRWLLSLGERAASEQDDGSGRPGAVALENAADALEVSARNAMTGIESGDLRAVSEWLQRLSDAEDADPSPRSWSLPAPPTDDVTAHVEWATVGTDEDGDEGIETFESKDEAVAAAGLWRRRGMTNVYVERHDVSTTRTIVEGEPQAGEPPRFERGFYRLARNLSVKFTGDYRRVRMVAVQDQSDDDVTVWTPGHGEAVVSAAALAAAGATRVEEGEPPAPERDVDPAVIEAARKPTPEPPRFERGFYRLARDLDVGRGPVKETVPAETQVAVVRVGGVDCSLWYPGGSGSMWSVPLTALAAAGAKRVEEEQA